MSEPVLKSFDELSRNELYEIMALRNEIFVTEQKITAEPDIDRKDPQCKHVIQRIPGADFIVGTARVFDHESPVKIGRLAVWKKVRGRGIGRRIMRFLQNRISPESAILNAQIELEDWYRRLGWRSIGEPFDEADIRHIRMKWSP
jgi:ElaA protein